MANVRCTECGRFVNGPEDHLESCSLHGKAKVYVGDEETNIEPGVVPQEPEVDKLSEPDVEQPTPEPTERKGADGDVVFVEDIGFEHAVIKLAWNHSIAMVSEDPDHKWVRVRINGVERTLTVTDALQCTAGRWNIAPRDVFLPRQQA